MKKIIQIFALPFILGILTILLHLYVEQTLFTWLLAKTAIVLTLITHLLAFPALLYCLKENSTIRDSYRRAITIVLPLLKALILYFIFVSGGAVVLFLPAFLLLALTTPQVAAFVIETNIYLLLSIPAFWFLVFFALSPYVVIFEAKKGFSALARSRELIRGRGWKMLGVFLLIHVIFLGFYFAIFYLLESFSLMLFALYIIALLHFLTLWLVFFKIYRGRKEIEITPQKTKKRNKILFALIIILGSISFGTEVIFGFNLLFRDYDPPFDDSYLVLPEVKMIEEGNLYLFLKEEGMIYSSDQPYESVGEDKCGGIKVVDPLKFMHEGEKQYDDYYEFIVANPEQAKEIVEKNEAAYRCFDRMAEHSHYTSPGEISLSQVVAINPGEMLVMARANSFKIAYLFYQGAEVEAMDRLINMAKVGTLLTDDPRPDLIVLLIGVAINGIALESYPPLEKINISLEDAVLYAEEIAEMELGEDSFARAMQTEYMRMAYGVDHTAEFLEEGGFIAEDFDVISSAFFNYPSFFWKPEKTKREFAKNYEPLIGLAPYENFIESEFYLETTRSMDLWPLSLLLWDNMAGRIIVASTVIVISPDERLEALRGANFLNRATRVALVVRAYEQEKGRLPTNLSELIPEYLSMIPTDPLYEGLEIGYSSEERSLYSIRKDEVPKDEIDSYIIKF